MKETLPFEPHEASHAPTLAERAFRMKLKAELHKLRRVFDQAHLLGPCMRLQEEYSDLRRWFYSHMTDIKSVLTRADEPRNGIATMTLEGRSADRLYRLINPWSLEVDLGSEPGAWRRVITDLVREAGGEMGKTRPCGPSRPRKAPGSRLVGTKPVLLDLS